jgi:hypothetical protein
MEALTPSEISAVKDTIAYLAERVEAELQQNVSRGDLVVGIKVLREVLAEAEEHG